MKKKNRLNQLREDFKEEQTLIEDMERQPEILSLTELSNKIFLWKRKRIIWESLEIKEAYNRALDYNTSGTTLLLTNQYSRGKYYELSARNGKDVRTYS